LNYENNQFWYQIIYFHNDNKTNLFLEDNMKKGIIVFLLVILTAGFSWAAGGAEKGGETETEIIELTIAHNMDFVTIPDGVVGAAERLNKKYAEEGRNIKIVFNKEYYTVDWNEYHNNLVFSHKSGDAPDIFSIANVPDSVEAGIVLPLDDLKVDGIYDVLWEPYTFKGSRYGMPVSLPIRVIYYNKSVLKELGWSSEEIEALPKKIEEKKFTFEDFMEIAETAVEKGITTYGITHRPKAGNDFFDILNTLGGEYYTDEGQLVFDEAGLLRTYEFFYRNANETGITPPNSSQLGWNTINQTVGNGDTFAYFGPIFSATYVAGSVNKSPEQLAEDVSFVLFPASKYNNTPFAVAAPDGIAISTQSKYPEICKEILLELATDSADLLATNGATTFSLASVEAANNDPQITEHPLLKDVAYMAAYAKTIPSITGFEFFRQEFFKQLELIELGSIMPKQALADFKIQVELNLENVVYK
jgi:inositol-phosphate transport system substrate-binding protein